jgi:quinol-cytochrome oxidoreductase complex cytochrome b subunit
MNSESLVIVPKWEILRFLALLRAFVHTTLWVYLIVGYCTDPTLSLNK